MSSIEPATNLNIDISYAHGQGNPIQGNAAMHNRNEMHQNVYLKNNINFGQENNDHNNDKQRASENTKNEVLVDDVDEIPQFTVSQTENTNSLKRKLKVPNQDEDSSVFQILNNNNDNASNILLALDKQNSRGKGEKSMNQKRKLLKKNDFESNQYLSTGRFTGSPNEENLTQNANLVKNLNLISIQKANEDQKDSIANKNDVSPDLQVQDSDRIGQVPNHFDNEMRETSYFKQQTDDEGGPNHDQSGGPQQPQSLSDLIQITNQEQTSQNIIGNQLQDNQSKRTEESTKNQGSQQTVDKNAEGLQLFKMTSKNQMKKKGAQLNIHKPTDEQKHSQNELDTSKSQGSSNLISPDALRVEQGTPVNHKTKILRAAIDFEVPENSKNIVIQKNMIPNEQVLRSHSYNQNAIQNQLNDSNGKLKTQILEKMIVENDINTTGKRLRKMTKIKQQNQTSGYQDESGIENNIEETQLNEIKKLNIQNEQQKQISNVTANFGALKLQKQNFSSYNKNNYSVLKGPEGAADNSEHSPKQQIMFTSMSDIGFPNGKQNQDQTDPEAIKQGENSTGKVQMRKLKTISENGYNAKMISTAEIISTDQIQRMMNTQNNWRVRTKTIDEMLHDVQDRIETDPEYMMVNSERCLDFFVQLLTDQNFKIVLNTLNILNMIIGMKQQKLRYDRLMKKEIAQDSSWGISNAVLGRHISLIVKKLADSKNILRQEAIKCLFNINEIMRSGNRKNNNFIALILPYLNNSSNWHIREELLNLLIKCFLTSQDTSEFDSFQILDSIIQLFNDQKDKIRNLALEAVAAFASIFDQSKLMEVIYQLKTSKEVRELIQSRIDDGMYPTINNEGNVELPYKDQLQNYDVDSVAHSMANHGYHNNQGQKINFDDGQYSKQQDVNVERNQSLIGENGLNINFQQIRGISSGRKIIATTAAATNQQLGVSHKDEIIQQSHIHSKRTASANNPNQLEFDNQNLLPHNLNIISDHNTANSFSHSVGGNSIKQNKEKRLPQFDENGFIKESNFLPKLQKVGSYTGNNPQYLPNHGQVLNRDRVVGSSGQPGMGYMGLGQGNLDPNIFVAKQGSIPISGGNKRSNKYIHGTPGHPHNYHGHFIQQTGKNLQNQLNRGNSGKVVGIHQINNSFSNPSPSILDQNTNILDMSGNIGSLFGAENFQNTSSKLNESMHGGGLGNGGSSHFKHISNMNGDFNYEMGPYSQQMSELGNVDHDFLLNAANYTNYHQTPSSFNQEQILYSAGGYRGDGINQMNVNIHADFNIQEGSSSFNLGRDIDYAPPDSLLNQKDSNGPYVKGLNESNKSQKLAIHPNTANSHNISEMIADGSTSQISSHINVIDGDFVSHAVQKQGNQNHQDQAMMGAYPPRKGQSNQSNIKYHNLGQFNQNTFYSDQTTFTGNTTTTGATSQNKGPNKIKILKGSGPPQHNMHDIIQNKEKLIGVGPIKATRAALGPQQDTNIQDLVIDNRKIISNNVKQSPKINTKISNQQFSANDKKQAQDDEEIENQDRSFSQGDIQNSEQNMNQTEQSSKEINSAVIRQSFNSNNMIGDQMTEDPALLTQSSKIQYIKTQDLEPLNHPDKEFKKCIMKGQGIYNKDWFVQFEACGIIRQVLKHHLSLLMQIGNQLQTIISTLIKLADSLRSAVSRIALITLNDMFVCLKRVMEPNLDPIIKILLKRGSDSNNFIANEADLCLIQLVQYCQESKVLQILQLQDVNSRSNQMRFKICQCLQNIVKQLGNNILFFKENDKLLIQLAKYLQDASQEVRQTAKIAFIQMSQAIMGQNELEKLLQRVLNEVQYKKVKEFLEKEPHHLIGNQGTQIDFVITNANNMNKLNQQQKQGGKTNQQSFKNLRLNNLIQKQQNNQFEQDQNIDQSLNIQAKQILNPQMAKNDQSNYLQKVASQTKGGSRFQQIKEEGQSDSQFLNYDQIFIDQIKELISKTQVNEWRSRLESSEALFELIRENQSKFTKNLKMVEIADFLGKLLNDSNAKIQLSTLDNFGTIFQQIFPYVETYIQIFYKSIISNLGSSNVGVRKNSESILRQINESISEKIILLQPLLNMIQYNSNARLKPALIDQLIDWLDHVQEKDVHSLLKTVLPASFKLLDDNKNEVKQRSEKLFKKLHSIMGQQVLDSCPQTKLQRVCDICLSNQKISLTGTGSSGKSNGGGSSKNSKGFVTSSFGANGNQLQLNSRS